MERDSPFLGLHPVSYRLDLGKAPRLSHPCFLTIRWRRIRTGYKLQGFFFLHRILHRYAVPAADSGRHLSAQPRPSALAHKLLIAYALIFKQLEIYKYVNGPIEGIYIAALFPIRSVLHPSILQLTSSLVMPLQIQVQSTSISHLSNQGSCLQSRETCFIEPITANCPRHRGSCRHTMTPPQYNTIQVGPRQNTTGTISYSVSRTF